VFQKHFQQSEVLNVNVSVFYKNVHEMVLSRINVRNVTLLGHFSQLIVRSCSIWDCFCQRSNRAAFVNNQTL